MYYLSDFFGVLLASCQGGRVRSSRAVHGQGTTRHKDNVLVVCSCLVMTEDSVVSDSSVCHCRDGWTGFCLAMGAVVGVNSQGAESGVAQFMNWPPTG
jgi:hypothetical protein